MRRTLTLGLAIALAACSSSSDAADSTTTTVERTTTTLTPDEAFTADIDNALTFDGTDGADASLALAQDICELLDTIAGISTDDASNDTPQTDAALIAQGATLAVDTAFVGDTSDDVIAVILRTAGEHLCPQHDTLIDTELVRRGL